MSTSKKLILILIRVLLVSIIFIALYTTFNWALNIYFELHYSEFAYNLAIPFLLPVIPVFIWIKPKLRLLPSKIVDLCFYISILTIGITTMTIQNYVIDESGTLTNLDEPSLINKSALTKYYSFKNYFIDFNNLSTFRKEFYDKKDHVYLIQELYIVMPIFDKTKDTSSLKTSFWLYKSFSQKIANGDIPYRNKEYDEFYKKKNDLLKLEKFNKVSFFELIYENDVREGGTKAIRANKNIISSGSPNLLKAYFENFENRNEMNFYLIFLVWGGGVFLLILVVLIGMYFINKVTNK